MTPKQLKRGIQIQEGIEVLKSKKEKVPETICCFKKNALGFTPEWITYPDRVMNDVRAILDHYIDEQLAILEKEFNEL